VRVISAAPEVSYNPLEMFDSNVIRVILVMCMITSRHVFLLFPSAITGMLLFVYAPLVPHYVVMYDPWIRHL